MPASRRQFIALVECPKFRPTNYVEFLKCAELAPLRFNLLSYALALRMIAHLMLYGVTCSFNFQTYLLSLVLLRLFECRKVVLWPLNRSFKLFFLDRPMYVSFEPSSSVVTVAWYMTDFVRHWPLSGQFAGFLQFMQIFSWLSCSLF